MSNKLDPGYYWARSKLHGHTPAPWEVVRFVDGHVYPTDLREEPCFERHFPDRWEIIKITTEREVFTTDTHVPSKGDETEYWDIGQRLKPPE